MLLLHMDSDVPPIAGKVDCGRGHHYSRIAREWPRDGRLQEASTVVVARRGILNSRQPADPEVNAHQISDCGS
jgi:hypothetical protein